MRPPGAGLHPQAYFQELYRNEPDPWGFDQRWYERRKHALTVNALPRRRYRRAVEPGCANGTLTMLLADRCEELIAHDFVADVVERARIRLQDQTNTTIELAPFPAWWPAGTGDLVVWSEIAYYLAGRTADHAIDRLEAWLEEDGDLVAVHYTGTTDYPRAGSEIGPWLDDVGFLHRIVTHHDAGFDLGVWRRD